MIKRFFISMVALVGIVSISATVSNRSKDYLSIGPKISFNKDQYLLSTSENYNDTCYRQWYPKKGDEDVWPLKKGLIIEYRMVNQSIDSTIINMLKEYKKQGFIVHDHLNETTKERTIDYLAFKDDKYIWNILRIVSLKNRFLRSYHYTQSGDLSDKNNKQKVLAFVKKNRMKMIKKLGKLELPEVNL